MGLKNVIKKIVFAIYRCVVKVNTKQILFIPHKGFYVNDGASLKNYRSDNTLAFLRYILEENKLSDYKLILASTNYKDKRIQDLAYASENFKDRNIGVIDFFDCGIHLGIFAHISFFHRRLVAELSSRIILSSEPHYLLCKRDKQLRVCASYYPAPFKSDNIPADSKFFMNYVEDSSKYDYFVTNSVLAAHIDSSYTRVDFDKFVNIGQCRTDFFGIQDDYSDIRRAIEQKVDYPVNTIILYTPTHRDYEQDVCNISRSILGFEFDSCRMSKFLKDNGIIVVCKLHPKQNSIVVNNVLPEGIYNI